MFQTMVEREKKPLTNNHKTMPRDIAVNNMHKMLLTNQNRAHAEAKAVCKIISSENGVHACNFEMTLHYLTL